MLPFREPAIIDINQCGREAAHRPGAIQSYGALLVVGPDDGRIRQASTNTEPILGIPAADLLGTLAAEVLPPGNAGFNAAIRALREGETVARVLPLARPTRLAVHRHGGRLLWEFEPEPPTAGALPAIDEAERAPAQAGSVFEACQAAVREVFRSVGYDRVMAYRLLPDDTGEVMAEARNPRVMPFLGLRFSAHDFPPQARRLQSILGVRIIPDMQAGPVDLLSLDPAECATVVDLSPVGLRAVSPFCLEYHRTIGVGATLTASIEVAGRLWGILSCHSEEPFRPGWEARDALRRLGQRLGATIEDLNRAEQVLQARRTARRERLLHDLAHPYADNPLVALVEQPERSLTVLGAEGVALVAGDRVLHLGHTPPPADIPAFLAALAAEPASDGPHGTGPERVFSTCRANALGPAGAAWLRNGASTMGVVLSREPLAGLLCFRPELRRDIDWFGDPSRPVTRDLHQQLHPRASFERWHMQVQGEGRPWRDDATALLARLVGPLLRDGERAAVATAAAIDRGVLRQRTATSRDGLGLPSPETVLMTIAETDGQSPRVTDLAGGYHLLFDLERVDLDQAEPGGPSAEAVLARIGLPPSVLALPDGVAEEHPVWSPLLGLRTIRVTLDTLCGSAGGDGWARVRRLRLDDVTGFARTIDGLEAARQRLLASDRARTSALTSMSHELRTPLNAIIGFSEIIKLEMMGPVSAPVYREYAGNIFNSGHHLLTLINEVLDLSKIDAGRRLLVEETIVLRDLVREVFDWTRTHFRDKPLDWTLSLPDEAVAVRADATALRQVLTNLLNNAGKYTPPGRSVALTCRTMIDGSVECVVADTGNGIPPADLAHVFKPFFRSNQPDAMTVEGTGIGLAISKALADMHGGTLELTSDGRSGTTARLTLPPWRRIERG